MPRNGMPARLEQSKNNFMDELQMANSERREKREGPPRGVHVAAIGSYRFSNKKSAPATGRLASSRSVVRDICSTVKSLAARAST